MCPFCQLSRALGSTAACCNRWSRSLFAFFLLLLLSLGDHGVQMQVDCRTYCAVLAICGWFQWRQLPCGRSFFCGTFLFYFSYFLYALIMVVVVSARWFIYLGASNALFNICMCMHTRTCTYTVLIVAYLLVGYFAKRRGAPVTSWTTLCWWFALFFSSLWPFW